MFLSGVPAAGTDWRTHLPAVAGLRLQVVPRGSTDQDPLSQLSTERAACSDLRRRIAQLEAAGARSRQTFCLLSKYTLLERLTLGNPTTDLRVQLAAERAACADLKRRIAGLESAPSKQQQQRKKTQKVQKTQAAVAGGQEALPGACEYVGWETQRG